MQSSELVRTRPPQRLCWRWARALPWIIHDVSSMDGFHGGGPLGRGWAPHGGRSKARQQHPGLARGADALPRLAYVSEDPTPWEHSAPVIEVISRIDVVRALACGVPSRDRPPRRFYGQTRRSRGGGGERAGVTLAPPAVHGADLTAQQGSAAPGRGPAHLRFVVLRARRTPSRQDCPADFPTCLSSRSGHGDTRRRGYVLHVPSDALDLLYPVTGIFTALLSSAEARHCDAVCLRP